MLKKTLLISALIGLVGCGGPLAGIDRFRDIDVAETNPTAQALPSEQEVAREGFFGTEAALGDQADTAQTQPVKAPPKKGGFLGILRRAVPTASAPNPTMNEEIVEEDVSPVIVSATNQIEPADTGDVVVASASPDADPVARTGFLGRILPQQVAKPDRSDAARDVAYGTRLPFGEVGRVCEARRKPLGRKVESASVRRFKLYDSDPGSKGQRTFYITGFKDDCPRQLTAANVLFGAPSFYELLHYGPAGRDMAFAETDRAYEKVKGRVCGARKGRPCGSKISQLERNTFFVNSYETLEGTGRWSELLVHDGDVVAASLKSNN